MFKNRCLGCCLIHAVKSLNRFIYLIADMDSDYIFLLCKTPVFVLKLSAIAECGEKSTASDR